MPVLIPRSRAISVRLSAEEHEALEKFCLDGGARCISDLARNAIRSFVSKASEESTLPRSLIEHSTQMKELEQRLESLAVELAALKAGLQPTITVNAIGGSEKRTKNRQKREPIKKLGDN